MRTLAAQPCTQKLQAIKEVNVQVHELHPILLTHGKFVLLDSSTGLIQQQAATAGVTTLLVTVATMPVDTR